MFRIRATYLATILCATAAPSLSSDIDDLTDLSFEDLLATEVTSVSRRPSNVFESAAATFVISQEDIRRSKATNLPDLLRMVPGVEVAQIDGSNYAVTARGFNGRTSNKLLVLIDGRTIYLSALSGILWDQQLVPVETIERIEVVRGPGATLWGANAVNGVINVITKHAIDTLGGRITTEYDTNESGRVFARQGARISDTASIRIYGTGQIDSALEDATGEEINDGSKNLQVGFRLDWEPDASNAFTLQGDYQDGDFDSSTLNPSLAPPFRVPFTADAGFSGANVLGRWTHNWSPDRALTLQAYWDRVERSELVDTFIRRDLFDIESTYRFRLGDRNDIVLGGNIRVTQDYTESGTLIIFDPDKRTNIWFGGFIQDDVTVIEDKFRLSLGSKFEYNEYTGFEVQPSLRAIWTADTDLALWAAVSRAVRTPARFERDASASFLVLEPLTADNPGPLPINTTALGNKNQDSEILIAYEAGLRFELTRALSADITVFYNDYDKILLNVPTTPVPVGTPFPTFLQLDSLTTNLSTAETYGIEADVKLRIAEWWRLTTAANFLRLNIDTESEAAGPRATRAFEEASPSFQVSARSHMDLTDRLEANIWLRHVGELDGENVGAYTDLDVDLTWRPLDRLEVFVQGENLLEDQRSEIFQPSFPWPQGFVNRRVKAGLSVRF